MLYVQRSIHMEFLRPLYFKEGTNLYILKEISCIPMPLSFAKIVTAVVGY